MLTLLVGVAFAVLCCVDTSRHTTCIFSGEVRDRLKWADGKLVKEAVEREVCAAIIVCMVREVCAAIVVCMVREVCCMYGEGGMCGHCYMCVW